MNGSPEPPNTPPATAESPAAPVQSAAPARQAAPQPEPVQSAAPRPAPGQPAAAPQPAPGQAYSAAHPGGVQRLHRKSPILAGLLSLLPGAGQIYVGYYKLGFIHNFVFGATVVFLAGAGNTAFEPLAPAMGIFIAFFVIYNVVDAGRRATLYNLALEGVEGIDLPSMDMDVSLPNPGGSIGGGVILIVAGVILLSNTLLGISLDWLAAWWPVIPIGLGVHLLLKALKERQAAASAAREPSRGSGSEPSSST